MLKDVGIVWSCTVHIFQGHSPLDKVKFIQEHVQYLWAQATSFPIALLISGFWLGSLLNELL